jgi:hypothetical protein
MTLGDLLGITPAGFNAKRKAQHRRTRKQTRKEKGKRETPAERRSRLDKQRRRTAGLGRGAYACRCTQ